MTYIDLRRLAVPKEHNPINPALNTVGVQWGKLCSFPCVSKIRHNITINKVACLRHAELGFLALPTLHFASCGGNRIKCFQHIYRTLIYFLYFGNSTQSYFL